ncbi:glycosyltransferase family 4 protein [Pararhizobium haloflavum]|uniref:glycosyltransferase family 4 protein n=1 Tax=Pararhizobium haloflavum TaxID=2037914 RepID=UPI000C18536F|nr:glycosyltransferase family 4 protein [Pararhizobium haloflavum]
MHVLHFFKTYWPDSFGGMERAIHAIVKGTAAHGVSSEVLSLSRNPRERTVEFDGHLALKAPLTADIASTGLSLTAWKLFAERARLADIVHYHFPWPYMDVAHFLARHGKPTVVTYQSDIVKQKRLMALYRPLMRRFLGNVDSIVCASPNYLRTSADLRPFKDKVTIIENGLAEADYPAPSDERLAHWRAALPAGFFLFTGVLRYYKGLHVLIEAARLSGLPVVIVGSGPMEDDLKRQAAGLENVHFLGALDDADKVALLALCRAFAFPSHLRSEAFGLSLVEAAMFAKPMISCEIGTGTSYINRDGETGLVVPPNDPEAFAAAMQRLATDGDAVEAFGKAARARYEAVFTAKRMATAYAELYRGLLAGRDGERGVATP